MKNLRIFIIALMVVIMTITSNVAIAASEQSMNSEVVQLLNELRKSKGLKTLTWSANSALQKAAQIRAREIAEVFSHTRPDGSDCFTVLKQSGLKYKTCGENIAYGTNLSAQGAMDLWTKSSGHYKNMVNPAFREVGVACYVSGDDIYWVQLFFTRM